MLKYFVLLMFFCRLLMAEQFIVGTFREFENALASARSADSILVKDGIYKIAGTWALQVRTDNLTIKGLSGVRENVIIEGRGMNADNHHGFWVDADCVTIQDLTIQNVRNHCIQTHVDADFLQVKNCVLRDAGEQMLKVPRDESVASPSDSGMVQDCLFEYSKGIGPRYYIGGIDCHFAKDWIVRRNVFRNIASPETMVAEHAIHFWNGSENTLCENNLIINCDRGIGYGLSNSQHKNGIIRNNIIYHDDSPGGGYADVSIEVFYSDQATIYNNTIYQEHSNYFAGIKNWGGANVSICNNIVHISDQFYGHLKQAIWVTAGGTGPVSFNVVAVPNPDLFGSVAVPDIERVGDITTFLHIRDETVTQLIDAGTSDIPGLPTPFIDFDETVRPVGAAIDIGADEFEGCVEVEGNTSENPSSYQLYQNYPNPFNSSTLFDVDLPEATEFSLIVYDISGRIVGTLFNGSKHAGRYQFHWQPDDLPSGIYFCRLQSKKSKVVKSVLMR